MPRPPPSSEPRVGAAGPLAGARFEKIALLGLSAYVIYPEFLLRKWWVDDAAITFSYARNLAHGDGLVPFVGAERSEGYSNPLWLALLALGQLVRLDPFILSKVLGGVLAAASVPVAWAITRRIRLPEPTSPISRAAPLIVAALVATNAQHTIWASAGLENALLDFLLAVGAWRLLIESDTGRGGEPSGGFPWSALAFAGAALTHSEGAIFGAFAFLVAAWLDLRRGRRRRIAAWAAAFGLPIVVYQAARYAYFALPFPLPYYAKVSDTPYRVFRWKSRCWTYLVHWGSRDGWSYLLPVLLAGVTRLRGWRMVTAGVWLVALAVAAVLPASKDVNLVRMALLTGMGLALPLLALPRRGSDEGHAVLLLTGLTTLSLAFAVATNGDWMTGFRRFSDLTVPMMVIYGLGVVHIATRLPRRLRTVVGALLVAPPIAWNVVFVTSYARHPTRMTPFTTRTRVYEFNRVARILHLRRPWVAVDHAMGGQMWFGPPNRTVDWYGITDVACSLHRQQKLFLVNYLTRPPRFDFVHMDVGFVNTKRFQSLYVKLPKARGRNTDNWVLRSLLAKRKWPGPMRPVTFADGHRLDGFVVRAPNVRAGGGLYIQLGLERPPADTADFGLKVFLRGPATAVLDVSPGYDGIFPPAKWRPDEVFIGQYSLLLPADLPLGDYDLGFALLSADGKVQPAASAPDDAVIDGETPVVGPGEVRFPNTIHVVSSDTVQELAERHWARAQQAAAAGDCTAAEEAWRDAVEQETLNRRWLHRMSQAAREPLSTCWARRAERESDLQAKVTDLERARRWDPRSAAAAEVGAKLADAIWPLAMKAREQGRHKQALDLFEAIVRAQPTRAWARRYAEEARSALMAEGRPFWRN